jgi:chromosome segregation ATPase
LFLSSFIGSKSNVDAREFSKAETKIKAMEKRINSLKDKPEMFREYIEENPTDYYLVQYYNSTVNGPIRDLRATANKIRTDKDMDLRERKERLDEVIKLQNMVKRNVLDTFESITGSPSIYR